MCVYELGIRLKCLRACVTSLMLIRYANGAPVLEADVVRRFGYMTGQETVILPQTFSTVQV